jgi:hypothetical protein
MHTNLLGEFRARLQQNDFDIIIFLISLVNPDFCFHVFRKQKTFIVKEKLGKIICHRSCEV